MKEISIKGTSRADIGKKATKALRRQGLVPCNIYGQQKDEKGQPVAVAFSISEKEANKLIYTPNIYLINLSLDGKECKAILRETQFHPVKDNVLHIDMLQVVEDKPIVIAVPVQTQGLAEGVRAGGKLVTLVRKINVRAFYKDVPEKLTIDVSNLQLGKSIKVGDLSFENLELVTPKEVNVVSVKMTRAAMSAANAAATTETPAAEEE
ncbi:MAG: 50S ribosomal protein L25/general stress protein Ctc [Alloprevotella sp.]|nr:50S ribosomal protein L25/general stress protein Ctc [Alloprevotella sp.]MBR6374698.1 50S ribosomal protein L25/general stress protein Ctc [Alloprevotella sp.]